LPGASQGRFKEKDMNISLTNMELTRFFFAIVLLIFFAHTLGHLFSRFKLPRVIGEIGGGLLLGPTVLGYFSPDLYNGLFSAFEAEGRLISLFYWLGLVLLMFISGFDIQKSLDRDDKKIILALTVGSTIIPFFAGWIAPSFYDFLPYLGDKKNIFALQLVIAIATAITSIPVLTKIFIDLNIINTRFAKIVLSTATVHDVILWVALAIATGLVSAEASSVSSILSHVLITIVFFSAALFVMPNVVGFLNRSEWNLLMRSSSVGYLLFICLLFSAVASHLSVNVVFGAMLAGVVISLVPEKLEKEKLHIKEVSLAFFIPLYFAIVGLKLDLIRHFDVLFFLWFLVFTTAFQMIGTMAAARLIRQDWLSSFNLGMAMTDRGGPAIVLATIALDLGIINETFFVTLVLIAIITSLSAGTWFKFILMKGYPLLKEDKEMLKEAEITPKANTRAIGSDN
jgi:Kef-type K+ transport system membrane component KefB